MGTYTGRVGSCCNNYNVQNGMYIGPYLNQDFSAAAALTPRVQAPSGWDNYKNVKSGQYNRQLCGECLAAKGFTQAPGVYSVNIVDTPLARPDYNAMAVADEAYQMYQARRMQNHPGSYNSEYVNYLNHQCGAVYPKRYVKGNWPDEVLIYTNTPACNGCHIANIQNE